MARHIIANEFIGFNAAQWIVDILDSDMAFSTDADCGTWKPTPVGGAQTTIKPGMWLVGAQLSPGTYVAQTQHGCYWERVRHFEGTLQAIIANDFVSGGGQRFVTIASTDVGFMSDAECGTWTKVQALTSGTVAMQSAGEIDQNRVRQRQQHGLGR